MSRNHLDSKRGPTSQSGSDRKHEMRWNSRRISGKLRSESSTLYFSLKSQIRHLRSFRPARRALLRRIVSLCIASMVLIHVNQANAASRDLRSSWEAESAVLVSTDQIDVGDLISADNTRVELRPADHVPAEALTAEPEDQTVASVHIDAGEILMVARTTGSGLRLRANRRAITVPITSAMPELAAGDHVDVIGSTPRDTWTAKPSSHADPADSPAVTHATENAVVMAVGDSETAGATATISVRDRDVGAVSAATLAGPVVLVLRAP